MSTSSREHGRRAGRLSIVGLVLAIGLVPLLVGAAFIERQETWRDHDSLDELLTRSAASQAEALENHSRPHARSFASLL